ncbi:DNA-deoxyinosine glycosylase [Sphingomonas sp.]|uniref:DNA-deoxyinosine glycosylase n=1 Tax=Sphingomonas sp. TaxID=28214 RepID=UPI0025DCB82B|nr:DNA-deoxyinosine glycosylase [Sphingomonas sp.]
MARKASFAPVVNENTRLLVLGSLPGDRSLALGRYYAHPQNQFWILMSAVVGFDLVMLEYEARLAAMLAAGVGLWDVVGRASRTGSSDAAIRDVTANDLAGLVRSLRSLRAIGFNGGTALAIGRRQLASVADTLVIVALPSSSPLHTIGVGAKQSAWDQLAKFLR